LIKKLDALSVAREMFEQKTLTNRELDSVTHKHSVQAAEELVKMLEKTSREIYESFETALLTTNQQHVLQLIECEGLINTSGAINDLGLFNSDIDELKHQTD